MTKFFKYTIPAILVGLAVFGISKAITQVRPSGLNNLATTTPGSLVAVSSTPDSLYSIPTGTTGSVLSVGTNGFASFVATSTLGFSGGGSGCTASGTAGSLQFSNGSGGCNADQARLFWNNTNRFLGVGTGTPQVPLHVFAQAGNIAPIQLDYDSATSSSFSFIEFSARNTPTGYLGYLGSAYGIAFINAAQSQYNLFVQDDGYIGIGTQNPNAQLNIAQIDGRDLFTITGGSSPYLKMKSTGLLGLNTTNPTSQLDVYGSAANSPFNVSSSTGTSFLKVLVNGSTTLSSLATASCDVLATAAGSLYCGTNGAGSITGSGTTGFAANWTSSSALGTAKLIDNGTVIGMNATSSTIGFNIQGTAGTNDTFNIASSSGTSVLRVTSAGNVGIGTTNPTAVNANSRLTVAGTGSQDIIASSTDNTTLSDAILQAYAPTSRIFMGAHGELQTTTRYGLTLGGWGEIGAFNLGTPTTTKGLVIGVQPASPIVFGTNNLERMRIDPSGLVAIGTTTPWAKLTLQADATSSTSTFLADFASSSGASYFMVTNGGKVGIGTTTPQGLLTLQGTSGNTSNLLTIATSTGASMLTLAPTGALTLKNPVNQSSEFVIQNAAGVNTVQVDTTDQGNGIMFEVASSSGTSLLDILGNGQVGINSSSPTSLLSLVGLSGNAMPVFTIASSTNTPLLTVLPSGRVGIGSTTPNYLLAVSGAVAFPNLTTSAGLQTGVVCVGAGGELINDSVACLASARRYKDNIHSLPVGLNELLQLNPVEFTWTKEFNKGFESDPNKNGVQYSLIADDVQKVDPNLTTVVTSGPEKGQVHGLADMNHWVALFVQSIKDMENQIVQIQLKNNEQDDKIEKMQAQIDKQQIQINLLLKLNK